MLQPFTKRCYKSNFTVDVWTRLLLYLPDMSTSDIHRLPKMKFVHEEHIYFVSRTIVFGCWSKLVPLSNSLSETTYLHGNENRITILATEPIISCHGWCWSSRIWVYVGLKLIGLQCKKRLIIYRNLMRQIKKVTFTFLGTIIDMGSQNPLLA